MQSLVLTPVFTDKAARRADRRGRLSPIRATLKAIGTAGFAYDSRALDARRACHVPLYIFSGRLRDIRRHFRRHTCGDFSPAGRVHHILSR